MLIKIIYSNVLSYLVKMIYKIHERIVGRNMRDERTIKLLCVPIMRNLNSTEIEIMTKLLNIAGLEIDLTKLLVNPMDDGGMGSLSIGTNYENRQLGQEVAEYMFDDVDGIPVSAALNVDTEGNLYELDIWKVDFSPTQLLK